MFFKMSYTQLIPMLFPNVFFRKLYLSLVLFLCMGYGVFSQNMGALAFPSPNNNFLGVAGTAFPASSVGVDL